MPEKPKLTLKKPLSLEKQAQIHQAMKSLRKPTLEKKKPSKREQERLDRDAQKKKKEGIKAALQWLQETYPACFNIKEPKPLKVKIEEDIFAELPLNLAKIKIRQAIQYYTRNLAYLKSLTRETHRYDLQGQPAQEIEPKHKAWAQEKLEGIKAAIQARKERASSKSQANKSLQE